MTLLLLWGTSCQTFGQTQALYTVVDLGVNVYPSAINNSGQVVGSYTSPSGWQHAFLWQNRVLTDLGTLGGPSSFAYGINSSGTIVGDSDAQPARRAFVYKNGQMAALSIPQQPYFSIYTATAINDREEIVGCYGDGECYGSGGYAFLYKDGTFQNITFNSWGVTSLYLIVPRAISNTGRIVGKSDFPLWAFEPPSAIPLMAHPDVQTYQQPWDINDSNAIVATALSRQQKMVPIIWVGGTPSILPLPPGCAAVTSGAVKINNRNQVIGLSCGPTIWQDGGAQYLQDLISPDSGWSPVDVADINDSGQIVGRATRNGVTHGVLLALTASLPVSVSIASNPPALTVVVDGQLLGTPLTLSWQPGSSHSVTVPSPQLLGSSRYAFGSWNDAASQDRTITVGQNALSLVANFDTQHLLTSSATPSAGGVITTSPPSTDGFYTSGAAIVVTAQARPGYAFSGFSVALTGATNPQALVMSAPRSVAANFSCVYSLATPATSVPGQGSIGNFGVTTGATCPWTAVASAPWITLTPPGTGTGPATIAFTVAANPTATPRTGTIGIEGQTFTINQAAACTYTLTPPGPATLNSAGESSAVTVSAPTGCAWAATSNAPWLVIAAGASGSGNGTVNYTAAANPNPVNRNGALTIAGQAFNVNQLAAPPAGCTYQLDTNTITIAASGGPARIAVTTVGAGCAWEAVSQNAWVTITSGASGTASGVVNLQILANAAASPRSGLLTIAGQTVAVNQSGTQIGNQTSGLRFVSFAPCRLMETRPEYNFEGRTGAFGPSFMTSGETRTLTLSQSNVCQVPGSAKAYVLNVTLVPRGTVDAVTIWPGGETRPNVASIRSPDGNIVANSAIVKSGSGAIQVYSAGNTDILIDITGYLTDDAGVNTVYFPLNPCRLIETRADYRQPAGPFGPPALTDQETRRFRIPSSPYCSVPLGASAYALTITVVPPGPLQFLTAWPSGGTRPNISQINSPAGRVLANNVIVPASADGSIDVFAFNRGDVIIDITGYFGPDTGQGLYYFPVTQCRLLDTQDTTLSGTQFGPPMMESESTRTVPIPSSTRCAGVPSTAKAYALGATVFPSGSPVPFLTLYPTGQPRPNASTLNAFQGQVVTNSTIVPAGTNGAIDLYVYRRTNVVLEISGYFGR